MTETEITEIKTNLQTTIDKLQQVWSDIDAIEFEDSETLGESIAVDLDDGDVEDWQQKLTNARDECEALSMHLDRSL